MTIPGFLVVGDLSASVGQHVPVLEFGDVAIGGELHCLWEAEHVLPAEMIDSLRDV